VAKWLVHRDDVVGQRDAVGDDGDVAREALRGVGAGVLLVGEGIETDREGVVHAGPAEGDLVGAACLLEALGSEGFREGGGDDPAAQLDLSGTEYRHQRERRVRVIVVEALRLRLEG